MAESSPTSSQFVVFSSDQMMVLALLVLAALQAAALPLAPAATNECVYNGFDFSQFGTSGDYTGIQSSPTYYYKFNFCKAVLATPSGSGCTSGYSAYQTSSSNYCYAALTRPTPVFYDTEYGVQLSYQDSDRLCNSQRTTFTINMICDETAPLFPPTSTPLLTTENPLGSCQYSTNFVTSAVCQMATATPPPPPVERIYYIAAVEREWDYAPQRYNLITGKDFGEMENVFLETGPERIGSVYQKALYREFTDATFLVEKQRTAAEAHLGFLGPVIRASVGDTLVVHFKNMASLPFSIHPHGVLYTKENEGASYNDGVNSTGGRVAPGATYIYRWSVPESAGPAANDASTVVWSYHSHTDEVADTAAGLVGPLVICGVGKCDKNAFPNDVDYEFFLVFYILNENSSPYLDYNIRTYTGNGAVANPDDEDFQESNLMHAINGYLWGNQPLMTVGLDSAVRWNVIGFGNENDLHTVHWHGQTLVEGGHRKDTLSVFPAESFTLDMVATNPGVWLLHCHVDDHMMGGMLTRFNVDGSR